MAHKQDGSVYQAAFHKLRSGFSQAQGLLSRWIGQLTHSFSIFENFHQNARPVPIEIHVQPVTIERVEVKIR